MDILDELGEHDEAAGSEGAKGGKPKVTEDDQDDGQDKTAPEAGGAQDEKEKAAEGKTGERRSGNLEVSALEASA